MPAEDPATSKFPIFAIAQARWEAHKADCSGFVRAVGADLGIGIPGMANEMVDSWTQDSAWTNLGADDAQASRLAEQGYLVVAGLKESGHGHVVVVVPGRSPHGDAMGYWGRLGRVGRENAGLGFAWRREELPSVTYFARPVPALAAKP